MNVLYLIFNRPHLQTESFEKLRAARPEKFFIAADGPRHYKEGEAEKCFLSRKIVDEIDWPCEVYTLFRDENLGCRRAISEAISWFFDHVNEGIIIEDDCVASKAFFDYAEMLLSYYRDDTRVWCISGNNFQNGVWRGDGSYYFSRYSHCWGWATWERSWRFYDGTMGKWDMAKSQKFVSSVFRNPLEQEYWTSIWDAMSKPETAVDTWDYQWLFTILSNGGLTVSPNRNLVTNIGYSEFGTHCFGETPDPGLEDFVDKIVHPSFILPNFEADDSTFAKCHQGEALAIQQSYVKRLRRKLKTLLRKATIDQ